MNREFILRLVLCGGLLISAGGADEQIPSGDATIRGSTADSEIVITTTARLAGAIHSLTWNGREFIDSHDHGRQLQSAINCDAGSTIAAETFNPTEAGSRDDGAGPSSTSRCLHLWADKHQLQTTTQMAFWLVPGQESGGEPAKNTSLRSNHLLTKRVTIGTDGFPQMLRYDVTFSLPIGERHNHVVFEALTGYMPAEFKIFERFDSASGRLQPLSDGPGEQADPVVLSTADGRFAMGIVALPSAVGEMRGPTYGRFRFPGARVVKWNCVYRVITKRQIPPGEYAFSMRVPIGTRTQVETMLKDWRAIADPSALPQRE